MAKPKRAAVYLYDAIGEGWGSGLTGWRFGGSLCGTTPSQFKKGFLICPT